MTEQSSPAPTPPAQPDKALDELNGRIQALKAGALILFVLGFFLEFMAKGDDKLRERAVKVASLAKEEAKKRCLLGPGPLPNCSTWPPAPSVVW
jgi:hypothetical protein